MSHPGPGGGGGGGLGCRGCTFRLKFINSSVCKVESSRQSPTEFEVIGHPLASMMEVFDFEH